MFRRLLVTREGFPPSRRLLPLGSLLLFMTLAMAGGTSTPGVRAQFVGGTLSIAPKTEVRLDVTDANILVFHCAKPKPGYHTPKSTLWSTGRTSAGVMRRRC